MTFGTKIIRILEEKSGEEITKHIQALLIVSLVIATTLNWFEAYFCIIDLTWNPGMHVISIYLQECSAYSTVLEFRLKG